MKLVGVSGGRVVSSVVVVVASDGRVV